MSPLSKFETSLYFGIWITGVSVSLYSLHSAGKILNSFHDEYHSEDFEKGWQILGGRYQDQADYEWNAWTRLTWKLLPFLLINLLGAEFFRHGGKVNLIPTWYTVVTLAFVTYHFNVIISLWFILLVATYYICLLFKSQTLIWTLTLMILHFLQPEFWHLNENEQYLVMISSSWIILRCISFCLDKFTEITNPKTIEKYVSDFMVLVGYSFYLPTMFYGPFFLFSHFDKGINLEFEKWNLKRFLDVLIKFSRCFLWYLFTQFSLHFIYVNAILLRPDLVRQLFDWELAGLGIAMGHFFHLKYVVFYGIPCAWAAAERFVMPDVPCCVSRIHLYSNMWRRFDHGLYQFFIKYIYIPIVTRLKWHNLLRKMTASVACFTFVFAWHREENYVFYWVLFNFIAVTIEGLGRYLFHMPSVHRLFTNRLSEGNILRMQCLLAAPLHYFSMVSNYFFIGNGMETGLIYLNKFLYGSPKSTLTILFFLYGAAHSAVAIQRWEFQKRQKLR